LYLYAPNTSILTLLLQVENIFGMWAVFSRCSGSIEEGRRFENLTWRLWYRETSAIESDNEKSESTSSSPATTKPSERRQGFGCHRSRGKERHVTPNDLQKLVITIKEKKDLEPLTISNHSYPALLANKSTPPQLNNTASPIVSASVHGTSTTSQRGAAYVGKLQ
jgi:hypothetical protein